jgi:hypothetical protein
MWGKEPLTVNQRWIKQAKGTYDFDVTKADKLFEFLVKEGRIKLLEGHSMLRPDGVKEKRSACSVGWWLVAGAGLF